MINQTEYTAHSTFEIDIVTIYIMNQTVHNVQTM